MIKFVCKQKRDKNIVLLLLVIGRLLFLFFSFTINRFSRRKLLLVSFLLAAMGAIGALLLSEKAKHDTGTDKK